MKLLIDNQKVTGKTDYTELLDAANPPVIKRVLNRPSILRAVFVGEIGMFVIPFAGAKVSIEREDGSHWFTGTIECAPQQEFVGRGLRGSIVRITFEARSDEILLDRSPLEKVTSIAQGNAAETLCRWTENAGSGAFDTSGVEQVGEVNAFSVGDGERWSEAVSRLADSCRAACVAENGAISLRRIGQQTHELSDEDESFIPEALTIEQTKSEICDWTVVGEVGPGMYVRDYFVGDGHTLRFPMSQQPFLRPSVVVLEEEYADELSSMKWDVANSRTIHTSAGKLVMTGDAGILSSVEALELGGCAVLEHGALVLNRASEGIVGGLYRESIVRANCLAGFAVKSAGGNTSLQALIGGAEVGSSLAVIYDHRYELTTRFYSTEAFRIGQSYRWSGGEETTPQNQADIRFVMEVRDLDSGAPLAAANVLYEGTLENAPALATYAVVNSESIDGSLAYTRVRRMPTAEVRTTSAADGKTRTRIVGLISDGAECMVTTGPAVYFYAPFKPTNGDQIIVTYRASDHMAARVYRSGAGASAIAEMVSVESPTARTGEDCRAAATALLNDSSAPRYQGSYTTWTDFLPTPIVPGDAIHVKVNSRGLEFTAVVRTVDTEIVDGRNDRAKCTLSFAEDGAELIGIKISRFGNALPKAPRATEAGEESAVATLSMAEVVSIASSSVQIDAGAELPDGGGIEVRREGDFGWGAGNDRNLIGRYSTRIFSVPRSTRGEDYYLRMFDAAPVRNYLPTTALLHVDVKDDAI